MTVVVESRMGAVAWGQWPTPRFPSPLIKPGVPISGTRLSDWLHRKAHGDKLTARGFGTMSNSPSPLDTAISGGSRGCACRLLPHTCSLPQMTGGSASALELSRPARASLCYGPSDRSAAQGRLRRRAPTQPSYPTEPPASFRTNRQLSG